VIRHVPEITVERIVSAAQDWNQIGVIGSAAVCVDGVLVPPVFLVRTVDGEVEQYLSVNLLLSELPSYVLDSELRERIWVEVSDAIDLKDAGGPDA
jgi:hypothetical protein